MGIAVIQFDGSTKEQLKDTLRVGLPSTTVICAKAAEAESYLHEQEEVRRRLYREEKQPYLPFS